jgi:hypothetical protein
VSDVVNDDTTVLDGDTSNDKDDDNNNNDDNNGGDDAVFFCASRMAAWEDRRFHEHFGVPFAIMRIMVWDMLVEGGLLPKKGEPNHLFWTLYFLKCHPKEGPGCAFVRGSRGAIDPKTMRKWVWLFLECICELADEVVSLFAPSCLRQIYSNALLSSSLLYRSISTAVSSTTS